MYSILVADDEPRHRKGIADMVRKLRADYTIFEAKDGEEALQLIMINEIDMVITDIKMPNLDGLQLIESLGTKIKMIKVVILSVYSIFEYAKKAISIGAFEYMLKPVVEQDMKEMLQKLEESIEKDRKLVEEKNSLEKKLNHTLPIYTEHLLNKWIRGELTTVELKEIEKILSCESADKVMISEIGGKNYMESDYSNEELDEIKLNFKYWMGEALKPLGHSISFFQEGKKNQMVSIFNSSPTSNICFSENIENVTIFMNNMRIEYQLDVTIGISQRCQDIMKEIGVAYEQAQIALNYKFYLGTGGIISYDKIASNLHKPALNWYKEEDRLHEAIVQMNRNQTVDILEELLNDMKEDWLPIPLRLQESMIYLILNQIKRKESLLMEEQSQKLIDSTKSLSSNCEHVDDLKNKGNDICLQMIIMLESRKNNKNSMIIQKSKEYIEEHYMEDISLETISSLVYFSPTYFSSFFKTYTGVSFSDYMLHVRMHKAKELLVTTNEKVYDVAFQAGYKDAGYFTKTFKREFGNSPEEYRRNHGLSGLSE
jgi:two-component system response regulator YesN